MEAERVVPFRDTPASTIQSLQALIDEQLVLFREEMVRKLHSARTVCEVGQKMPLMPGEIEELRKLADVIAGVEQRLEALRTR